MHGITRNYSLVANEKKESSHRDAHLLWHIVNIYLIASARFFAMYPSSLAWSYITTVLSWHFSSSGEWNNNGAASWFAPMHARRTVVSLFASVTPVSQRQNPTSHQLLGRENTRSHSETSKHEGPVCSVVVSLRVRALFIASQTLW